jgi:hypothetical protein
MKDIWWINPGKLILFFLVPVYSFVVFAVPRLWPEMIVLKAGMYARGAYAVYGLAALLCVGIFGLIGSKVSIDGRQSASSVAVRPALLVSVGLIAITAYVIWFYPAVLRGSFIADREAMNRTPGVTSFSQLGVAYVMAYLAATLVAHQDLGPAIRFQFRVILILTILRVQLWSERLAFIELGVPMTAIILTHRRPRTTPGRWIYRLIGSVGPFLGIPLLLLVFTVTEFFRSWTIYSKTQNIPLLDFMTSRLVTYYFTALNNGAGMLATQEGRWPTFDFYNTMEWLYRLPLGIGRAAQELFLRHEAASEFLERWADVEFNNMSGIFPIVYDLGYIGATLYFCGFGFAAGVLYRSMVNGRALGLLFFAPFYVGCLEIMRIAYINGSRVVLIIVGCTLFYLQIRTARSRFARRENFSERSRA